MKIGHTGITWGIPADLEVAYRETAELGYMGFETFARSIIEWNEKPGGYRALIEQNGIPTNAVFCHKEWVFADTVARELAEARHEADVAREVGASGLILQGGSRPPGGHTRDTMNRLAETLNQIGAYCREIGLVAALHPHTGTGIETREDIETILSLTDPGLVGFAPDTGQIAKGGSDIVEVLRTYLDRIEHVHLKDWCGTFERDAAGKEIDPTGYVGYEPVGNGVLPMPEILDVLKGASQDIWVNVELDGTSRSPRTPRAAAAMSRDYLGEVLGNRVAWIR
jgi:inosose dehydratase